MERKQSHSEWMVGSWRCYLRRMLQKRLKNSATWAITIIIKCYFANSFLLLDRRMRPKNLINQNLLIKIAKGTPFHIRNKPKSLKINQGEKQLKNTDFLSPTNKQLELCINLIHNQLKNDPQAFRDLFQRIAKLLLQVKAKWQPMDQQTNDVEGEQLEEPQFRVVRKSSSKYLSRNKLQIQEQIKLPEGPFFTEKCCTQSKKNKLIKVKIGKQNNQRLFGASEQKTDKSANKLEQAQNQVRLHKAEISKLQQQIQNMLEINQKLKNQKNQWQLQIKELKYNLQSLAEQKLRYQSTCEESIKALKKQEEQNISAIALLSDCLKQREKQITAIWQLQIF